MTSEQKTGPDPESYDIGLRVGTFNLRNFALPDFQFYPNLDAYSADEYAAKRDWTAQQIDKMNCDVIVFQEVFHIQALEEAVRASRTMRNAKVIGRDAVVMPPKGGLVPQVAIVTRLPLAQEPIWVADYSDKVNITLPGHDEPIKKSPAPCHMSQWCYPIMSNCMCSACTSNPNAPIIWTQKTTATLTIWHWPPTAR